MEVTATGRASKDRSSGVLYFMHALGRQALPEVVTSAGRSFCVTHFIKHDFFAATGFYTDRQTGERVVLKIGRTEPFVGLPCRWIGRWLCRRETRFYTKLSDLPNVPKIIGLVGDTGFIHAYAPGRPLEKGRPVPDDFFDQTLQLIDTLYTRGVAVVDTNKPENILLGTDGRPHLIDFQISYDTADLGDVWPANLLLRAFRRSDIYHILKHKKRLRPDLLTAAELAIVQRSSVAIRLHRRLTKPYFLIRRKLFAVLRAKGKLMPEGSK